MSQRVNVVVELIVKGSSRSDIIRYSAENWNISERQTDNLIERVRLQIKDDWDMDRIALIAESLARMNLVIKHGFRIDDLKAVVSATKLQAELAQLIDHRNRRI